MSSGSALKGRRRRRRTQDGRCEGALIFYRQPDNLCFLNGPTGSFLRSRNDEIADAAPLELGGSFDDGQGVGGDPSLDAGRSGRVLIQNNASLSLLIVRQFTGQIKNKEKAEGGTSKAVHRERLAPKPSASTSSATCAGPARFLAESARQIKGMIWRRLAANEAG